MKEASIVPVVDEWLAGLFTDDQIDSTCAALESTFGPDPAEAAFELATRRKLKECDAKLARYRQALEAGSDPSIVSGWIEEVKLERKAAELQLRRKRGDGRMTGEEIRSLVEQLKGIVGVLENAYPEDRRSIYQELNVSVHYHTDGRLHVKAGPSACTNECVGGGLERRPGRSGWWRGFRVVAGQRRFSGGCRSGRSRRFRPVSGNSDDKVMTSDTRRGPQLSRQEQAIGRSATVGGVGSERTPRWLVSVGHL